MTVRAGLTIACLLCAGLSCHADRSLGLAEALHGRWYVTTVGGSTFPFVSVFSPGSHSYAGTDSMWFEFQNGVAINANYGYSYSWGIGGPWADSISYNYTFSDGVVTLTPTGNVGVQQVAAERYAGDTLILAFERNTGPACEYGLLRVKQPRGYATIGFPC